MAPIDPELSPRTREAIIAAQYDFSDSDSSIAAHQGHDRDDSSEPDEALIAAQQFSRAGLNERDNVALFVDGRTVIPGELQEDTQAQSATTREANDSAANVGTSNVESNEVQVMVSFQYDDTVKHIPLDLPKAMTVAELKSVLYEHFDVAVEHQRLLVGRVVMSDADSKISEYGLDEISLQHQIRLEKVEGPMAPVNASTTQVSNTFAPADYYEPSESLPYRRIYSESDSDSDIIDTGRAASGLVGLRNQGATCYLNSLVQVLYLTPEFRSMIYDAPVDLQPIPEDENVDTTPDAKDDSKTASSERKGPEKDDPKSRSYIYQLQMLFGRLQVSDVHSSSTQGLTKSFGWDSQDVFMQHDVQELLLVLCDKLEGKLADTIHKNTIKNLYRGSMRNMIRCTVCGYTSTRDEDFTDVTLSVKGRDTIIQALDELTATEVLDGDNAYLCEKCDCKQKAEKSTKFKSLPEILNIVLMRFDFDWEQEVRFKLNDPISYPLYAQFDKFMVDSSDEESPSTKTADVPESDSSEPAYTAIGTDGPLYELFAILMHSGTAGCGHYFAFIRHPYLHTWFKFNDEFVTAVNEEDIWEVCSGHTPSHVVPRIRVAGVDFPDTPNAHSDTSAYMLVYRRRNPGIIGEVTNDNDIKVDLRGKGAAMKVVPDGKFAGFVPKPVVADKKDGFAHDLDELPRVLPSDTGAGNQQAREPTDVINQTADLSISSSEVDGYAQYGADDFFEVPDDDMKAWVQVADDFDKNLKVTNKDISEVAGAAKDILLAKYGDTDDENDSDSSSEAESTSPFPLYHFRVMPLKLPGIGISDIPVPVQSVLIEEQKKREKAKERRDKMLNEVCIIVYRCRLSLPRLTLTLDRNQTLQEIIENSLPTLNEDELSKGLIRNEPPNYRIRRILNRQNGTKRPSVVFRPHEFKLTLSALGMSHRGGVYVEQNNAGFPMPEIEEKNEIFVSIRWWGDDFTEPLSLCDIIIGKESTLWDLKMLLSAKYLPYDPQDLVVVEEETPVKINNMFDDDTTMHEYGLLTGDILHVEHLTPYNLRGGKGPDASEVVCSRAKEYFVTKEAQLSITVMESMASYKARYSAVYKRLNEDREAKNEANDKSKVETEEKPDMCKVEKEIEKILLEGHGADKEKNVLDAVDIAMDLALEQGDVVLKDNEDEGEPLDGDLKPVEKDKDGSVGAVDPKKIEKDTGIRRIMLKIATTKTETLHGIRGRIAKHCGIDSSFLRLLVKDVFGDKILQGDDEPLSLVLKNPRERGLVEEIALVVLNVPEHLAKDDRVIPVQYYQMGRYYSQSFEVVLKKRSNIRALKQAVADHLCEDVRSIVLTEWYRDYFYRIFLLDTLAIEAANISLGDIIRVDTLDHTTLRIDAPWRANQPSKPPILGLDEPSTAPASTVSRTSEMDKENVGPKRIQPTQVEPVDEQKDDDDRESCVVVQLVQFLGWETTNYSRSMLYSTPHMLAIPISMTLRELAHEVCKKLELPFDALCLGVGRSFPIFEDSLHIMEEEIVEEEDEKEVPDEKAGTKRKDKEKRTTLNSNCVVVKEYLIKHLDVICAEDTRPGVVESSAPVKKERVKEQALKIQ